MHWEIIAGLVVFAILFILAVILYKGQATFLIAGYNTMSERERARWDKRMLGKAAGVLLMIVAALALGVFVFDALALSTAATVCGIAMPVVAIVGAVYVNVSKRFKNE